MFKKIRKLLIFSVLSCFIPCGSIRPLTLSAIHHISLLAASLCCSRAKVLSGRTQGQGKNPGDQRFPRAIGNREKSSWPRCRQCPGAGGLSERSASGLGRQFPGSPCRRPGRGLATEFRVCCRTNRALCFLTCCLVGLVQSPERTDPDCDLVATVGNHEFDEGVTEMKRLIYGGNHPNGPFLENPYQGAKFPVCGCECRFSQQTTNQFSHLMSLNRLWVCPWPSSARS